jgi:hypothetical protein
MAITASNTCRQLACAGFISTNRCYDLFDWGLIIYSARIAPPRGPQAIAEHGSFGRAAKALGHTQSAIASRWPRSSALSAKLTSGVGRPARRVATEAGELLLGMPRRSWPG